jgi:hypothetical protein
MNALPDPLTPADCDLRGLPYMPLDVIRLLDSDMFAEATGDEFKAAVALWCKSWTQIPAGSLPNKDPVLAHLSSAKNWKRVKAGAMRGWILCTDDRWYHPVVAEKVLNALPGREEFNSKKSAEAERKARERDDRKALFELLKSHNIVLDWNVSTKVLRGMAAQHQSHDLLGHVTDVARDMSQPVTVCKGERREREEEEEDLKEKSSSQAVPAEPAPEQKAERERPSQPVQLDRHVQIALLLRAQGVNVTAMNPLVAVTWAQNPKCTDDILNIAVAKAKATLEKQGRAENPSEHYLKPIIEQLLAQQDAPPASAATPRPAAPPRKPQGMDPKGLDESYDDWQARTAKAEAARRKQNSPPGEST